MGRGQFARRRLLAVVASLGLADPAGAQAPEPRGAAGDWPARPIGVIMPLQAGSASDAALRIVLERMEERLGQRFVVENPTGAAGQPGTERAARARPDGYSLAGLNNSILTILPNLRLGMAFDPFEDFVPIHGLASIPTSLAVHAAVPARTVPELVALAARTGGEMNYASGGVGSPQHLATEMFMAMSGAKLTHVSYRGVNAAAADLAAGHVQMMFLSHAVALPFLDTGRVRLVAYAGAERSAAFPAMPTIGESGVPGYEYASWIALFAPRGTPAPIVARLRAEAARALAMPDVGARLTRAGLEAWPLDHVRLAETMQRDHARWREVVRVSSIPPD